MMIRAETPGDIDSIRQLTEAAFKPMPFSEGTEARIVDDLRLAGDLTISLVAVEDGDVIGHVAFSPIDIDGQHRGWFGLGPISVAIARQRQGIGKMLISKGLELLRNRGANGCALIGNPDIYGRVGFSSDGRLKYRSIEARLVQHLVLKGEAPVGTIRFAPAFEA
jgi:putative acetyltransferase